MVKRLIGKKLKATRLKNDMTIQELSDKSGVSSNMISRVERGLTIPSVDILMKLGGAFGKSINYFVEEAERGTTVVYTPRDQGEPLFFFQDKHQVTGLSLGLRDPSFAVFYDTLEAGCNSGDGVMVHSGDEFAQVLKGRMEFVIEGERYLLEEGDSITFKAAQEHRWANIFEGKTLVMWIVSPVPEITR